MDNTSETLLKGVQKGEKAAWERFVDLYTPLLYYWALKRGCAKSDAADLVQEVLAILVRELPKFTYDQQGSFRSWPRQVAYNCWHNLQRRAKLPMEANPADDIPQPYDDSFSEKEFRRHLSHRALELMKSEFQETTWKACWEMVVNGKSAEQVSQELGISKGAVYVAKSRVLAKLRQELAGMLE